MAGETLRLMDERSLGNAITAALENLQRVKGEAGIIAIGVSPLVFSRGAWAQEFCNNSTGGTVTFGLNLPLTGAYAASFSNASLMMGLVLLVTAAFWFVGRRLGADPGDAGE